jgi:hypothetical protein
MSVLSVKSDAYCHVKGEKDVEVKIFNVLRIIILIDTIFKLSEVQKHNG